MENKVVGKTSDVIASFLVGGLLDLHAIVLAKDGCQWHLWNDIFLGFVLVQRRGWQVQCKEQERYIGC